MLPNRSLIEDYGTTGSFHRQVGDVAGMDMIAIPMDTVNAEIGASQEQPVDYEAGWSCCSGPSLSLFGTW